jgi:hypothetical protein
MTSNTYLSEHSSQAVFCVCADEDVVQVATSAASNISGEVSTKDN